MSNSESQPLKGTVTSAEALARLARATLAGVLLTSGLAACNDGSDDPTLPAVVAGADTLTIELGQSASLLANDSLGGVAATAGATGNVGFTVTSGPLPAGVSAVDGTVAVGTAAAPGTFNLSYALCALANPGNCATASAQITVPPLAIVAGDDTLTLAPGASGDVLANDSLGGAPATSATVSSSATALPAGIELSAGGLLTVGASAASGSFPFSYRICQVTVPANCAAGTVTVTVPATGLLSGRAVDSATGSGVAGVTVSAGSATATTDAGGNFSIANAPVGERVSVLFTSPTYAPTARVASISASGSTDVQARLVQTVVNVVLDAAAGGTVSVPGSTAQVTLPANAVQRSDGSVPTGNVTVLLTPLDPASDATVMPGDFTTLVAGVATAIESFGALSVQLRDATGAPLSLRAGQLASLRIPLATRSASVPATLPLYYFDEASGRWVQEGTATLAGSGAARYYEGTVARLATWNADQVYDSVRISGCVADASGVRIVGAQVGGDGIDYSGTSVTTSDSNGTYVLTIRKDSLAAVTGAASGRLTNTVRMGPFAADTSVPDCLALGQTGAGITMKLTWGATPRDLDSHLFAPNGSHVYFGSKGNLTATPFANLDVDDISSFGPEVVTLTKLIVGTYKYAVRNYSGYGNGSIGASGARVELNVQGRAVELFGPPATGESSATNWWIPFELDVAADCTVSVRRMAMFSASPPTSAPASEAVYCTTP